jgi:UDP:flavonoid glycosyltransferase YjiC (YdhE family)
MLLHSLAPLWAAEGAGAPTLQAIAGDLYLHPFPPSLGGAPEIDGVRPVRPQSTRPSADDLPPWLVSFGRDRPGVYLTAGTEALAPQAPWAEALAALGSMPVDVVVTLGPFVDPASFGPIPPNVHVERFVPHGAVLERASLVASHGGAGTLLASASLGLPQLLFPLGADQWENADAIAAAGAGIVCEPEARSSSQLAEAIDRLLHDSAVLAAAQRLATEIRAMPTAADHVAEITLLTDR